MGRGYEVRQNVLFPSWFLSVQLGRQLRSLRDQGKSPLLSPLQPCVETQQEYGKAGTGHRGKGV